MIGLTSRFLWDNSYAPTKEVLYRRSLLEVGIDQFTKSGYRSMKEVAEYLYQGWLDCGSDTIFIPSWKCLLVLLFSALGERRSEGNFSGKQLFA